MLRGYVGMPFGETAASKASVGTLMGSFFDDELGNLKTDFQGLELERGEGWGSCVVKCDCDGASKWEWEWWIAGEGMAGVAGEAPEALKAGPKTGPNVGKGFRDEELNNYAVQRKSPIM